MKRLITIIPVPYEKTTSYNKGTKNGPKAILSAFEQVEQYDIELDKPTDSIPIKILPAVKNLKDIRYNPCVGELSVYLGGEHTITAAIIKVIKSNVGANGRSPLHNFSVLHLDAHSDLRDTYQGKKYSHACVMRRVWEMGVPFVSVGVRSQSYEEKRFIDNVGADLRVCPHNRGEHIGSPLHIFYAHQIHKDKNWIKKVINKLSKNIYISFDVDVFDPSVIRATGTPEPGGLDWYQVTDLLLALKKSGKNLIGMDIVELSPVKTDLASNFTCAKLLHKVLAIFC